MGKRSSPDQSIFKFLRLIGIIFRSKPFGPSGDPGKDIIYHGRVERRKSALVAKC